MKKRLFICLLILTLLAGTAFAFSASGESLRRRGRRCLERSGRAAGITTTVTVGHGHENPE